MVRQSIEQLCTADHGNDAATLTRWLANKTPVIRGRRIPTFRMMGRQDSPQKAI